MGIGSAWGTREELLHPRGRDGRFITKAKMSLGVVDALQKILDAFRPRTWRNDAQAAQYTRNIAKPGGLAGGTGGPRFKADFDSVQEDLRDGVIDNPSTQKFVKMMDQSAIELPDDLILSRVVSPAAFGLTPETMADPENGLESRIGHLFADRGYSSTNVGTPLQGPPGSITMVMATPRGTKAIIPTEVDGGGAREVVLDRNQEFRLTKVTPKPGGGYYAQVVATPRTPGETPLPEGGHVGARIPNAEREARIEALRQGQAKRMKAGTEEQVPTPTPEQQPLGEEHVLPTTPPVPGEPLPGRAPLAEHPDSGKPSPVGPSPTPGPGSPAARQEPTVTESAGSQTPRSAAPAASPQAKAEAPTAQPPPPPAPEETPQATPIPNKPSNFRTAAREAGLQAPTDGQMRAQFNKAFADLTSGKRHPEDVIRDLDADIEHEQHGADIEKEDSIDAGAGLRAQKDVDRLKALRDLAADHYGLGRREEQAPAAPEVPAAPEAPAKAAKAAARKAPAKKATEFHQRPVTRTPEEQRRSDDAVLRRAESLPATPRNEEEQRIKDHAERIRAERAGTAPAKKSAKKAAPVAKKAAPVKAAPVAKKAAPAKAVPAKKAAAPATPEPNSEDLGGTIADLRRIAGNEGVDLKGKRLKADIRQAILDHRGGRNEHPRLSTPEGQAATHVTGERAADVLDHPDRQNQFREAFEQSDVHPSTDAAGRSIREVADDLEKGNLGPDEALRRIENDIAFNRDDLSDIEHQIRRAESEGPDNPDLKLLQARRKQLAEGIQAQERMSKFLRQHFGKEGDGDVPTPAEVVDAAPELPDGRRIVSPDMTPDQAREGVRMAGLEPRGDTAEEIARNAIKDLVKRKVERHNAKDEDLQKLIKEATAQGSPNLEVLSRGLDIPKAWQQRIQQQLNDPKMTTGKIADQIEQGLRGPAGPAGMAGIMKLTAPEKRDEKWQREYDRLRQQSAGLAQLVGRLRALPRRRAAKLSEAETPPPPTPSETKFADRIGEIVDMPPEKVVEAVRSFKAAGRAEPTQAGKDYHTMLGQAQSVEEQDGILKAIRKPGLIDVARAAGLSPKSSTTVPELKRMIKEATPTGGNGRTGELADVRGEQLQRVARARDLGSLLAEAEFLHDQDASKRVVTTRLRNESRGRNLPEGFLDRVNAAVNDDDAMERLRQEVANTEGVHRLTPGSGQRTNFDPALHDGPAGLSTGDAVTVDRPGYGIEEGGARRPIVKARVRPVESPTPPAKKAVAKAAKKAAPAAPFDADATITKLRERDKNNVPVLDRESATKLLDEMKLSRAQLLELAKKESIPGASSKTIPELKREIVQSTVGRRLESIAIRGFTGNRPGEGISTREPTPFLRPTTTGETAPERPGLAKVLPLRPSKKATPPKPEPPSPPPAKKAVPKKAEAPAKALASVTPIKKAAPAKAAPPASQPVRERFGFQAGSAADVAKRTGRTQGDEPLRVPNNGADQGRLHLDGDIGRLWGDLVEDGRAPNSTVNRISELGERVGTGDISLEDAVQEIRKLQTGADPAVAERIRRAVADLSPPPMKVEVPDGTPPAVKEWLENLAKVPNFRRDRIPGQSARESYVAQAEQLIRDISEGRHPARSDALSRLTDVPLHESVDGVIAQRKVNHDTFHPPQKIRQGDKEVINPQWQALRDWIRAGQQKNLDAERKSSSGKSSVESLLDRSGNMTIPELRAAAKDLGVAGADNMNKNQIIDALEKLT